MPLCFFSFGPLHYPWQTHLSCEHAQQDAAATNPGKETEMTPLSSECSFVPYPSQVHARLAHAHLELAHLVHTRDEPPTRIS